MGNKPCNYETLKNLTIRIPGEVEKGDIGFNIAPAGYLWSEEADETSGSCELMLSKHASADNNSIVIGAAFYLSFNAEFNPKNADGVPSITFSLGKLAPEGTELGSMFGLSAVSAFVAAAAASVLAF